jgi:hypothetical protein
LRPALAGCGHSREGGEKRGTTLIRLTTCCRLGRWLLIPGLLAATACTFNDDLTGQAGRFNRSLEELQNQALVLNIVRQSYNAPMSFTQISVVRGSGTIGGTLTMPTITAIPGQATQYVLGPNTASVQSNANFDMATLDSKEFWVGLMTPLTADTLGYFIRQGVPRDMLFYLYIDKIEIGEGKAKQILVNDPEDPSFGEFARQLDEALALGFTTTPVTHTLPYGPPLTQSQAGHIKDLTELAKAGMVLVPVPGKTGTAYQIQVTRTASVLCFDEALATSRMAANLRTDATCAGMAKPPTAGGAHTSVSSQSHAFTYTRKSGGRTPDVVVKTYPRSTYDILRYLGALVRYRRDHRNDQPVTDAAAVPAFPAHDLFVLERRPFAADSFISVWYRGETYSIPGTSPSTIQVLSLVRQLVALSTSINALPASNTVTTVVQ